MRLEPGLVHLHGLWKRGEDPAPSVGYFYVIDANIVAQDQIEDVVANLGVDLKTEELISG